MFSPESLLIQIRGVGKRHRQTLMVMYQYPSSKVRQYFILWSMTKHSILIIYT